MVPQKFKPVSDFNLLTPVVPLPDESVGEYVARLFPFYGTKPLASILSGVPDNVSLAEYNQMEPQRRVMPQRKLNKESQLRYLMNLLDPYAPVCAGCPFTADYDAPDHWSGSNCSVCEREFCTDCADHVDMEQVLLCSECARGKKSKLK